MEYSMPYNVKLFILRIIIQSHDCLFRITLSHLKPFNCLQANEYY